MCFASSASIAADNSSSITEDVLLLISVLFSKLIEFASIIDKTIDENAPITIKEGGLIKAGVNGELDYIKDLLTGGEKWLKDFEEKCKIKCYNGISLS